jgi:hypothetical protein
MPQETCIRLLSRGYVNSYIKFFTLHEHIPKAQYAMLEQLLTGVEESTRSGISALM